MHFTDEEKEIIKKIALKERYTLNDFFADNFKNRVTVKIIKSYSSPFGESWYIIESESDVFIFQSSYKLVVNKFIYIWKILVNIDFAVELKIVDGKIKENSKNFFYKENGEIGFLNNIAFDYEYFFRNELLVFQSNLQQFINDGFKTKEELRIEEEIKARNEALKDAKKSFWVSVFLAVLSVVVSVIPLFKDDKVIVKNQINTQQLESQLKQTNQELKDIKNKFEELQKQSQISTKK